MNYILAKRIIKKAYESPYHSDRFLFYVNLSGIMNNIEKVHISSIEKVSIDMSLPKS